MKKKNKIKLTNEKEKPAVEGGGNQNFLLLKDSNASLDVYLPRFSWKILVEFSVEMLGIVRRMKGKKKEGRECRLI